MKEIGSEFWDIPVGSLSNRLFEDNIVWFVSGTSALYYVIDDILQKCNAKKAAIPSWCCECMITPFLKRNIQIEYYPVFLDDNRTLTCDFSSCQDVDITLTMHYFGFCSERRIGKPTGVHIEDVTHSVFSGKWTEAEYYIGSLRKWTGFFTGGFSVAKSKWGYHDNIVDLDYHYVSLRQNAMEKKKKYIDGLSDSKDYLINYNQAEKYLDSYEVMIGDPRDQEKAKLLDIELLRRKRRENAAILMEKLKDYLLFPVMSKNDCPLFVPIILEKEKRDRLKRYLISKSIYCPIHWPISSFHVLNKKTKLIYDSELSIVCDQRYSLDDMERIVSEITKSGLL